MANPGSNTVSVLMNRLGNTAVTDPERTRSLSLAVAPNPAAWRARVSFVMAAAATGRLDVIDVTGRVVTSRALGHLDPGPHAIDLDAKGWAAGLYVLRLHAGATSQASKLFVVR